MINIILKFNFRGVNYVMGQTQNVLVQVQHKNDLFSDQYDTIK